MTRRQFNALRVLGAIAAVILLGWWAWPDHDRVRSEDELIERAVRALRTGEFASLAAAAPSETDRLHVNNQLHSLSFLPNPKRLEESFRGSLTSFINWDDGASMQLAGRDAIEFSPQDPRLRTLPFRVEIDGEEHRFRLQHCFLTPRGWVCFGGLHYNGPVDGILNGDPFGTVAGEERFAFYFDADLPKANQVELLEQVRACLEGSAFANGHAVILSGGRLRVTFPPGGPLDPNLVLPRTQAVPAILTGRAGLRVGIEVLPVEVSEKRRPAGLSRVRTSEPWTRSAEAFERYKHVELQRLKELEAKGQPYIPSQQGYRLVKRFGRVGASPEDYVVVETRPDPAVMDGPAFSMALIHGGHAGTWSGYASIAPQHAHEFNAWRDGNVGYHLVIIVNGEVHATELITSASNDDAVHWTYAAGTSRHELERANKFLISGAGLPAIEYALRFEGSRRR